MKNLFILIFIFCISIIHAQITKTFTTSGTFTVPAGVTSIFVEAWGGGGSGGGALGNSSPQYRGMGGGGGGGAYQSGTVSVVPGQVISYIVAPQSAESTTTVIDGSPSSFLSIIAQGGKGGQPVVANTSHIGGAGGAGGVGTNNGGNGGNGTGFTGTTTNTQPGGGGSGGTISSGGDGLNWQPSANAITRGLGGSIGGGNGGNGAANSGNNGLNGSIPGGGGSGAYAAASNIQRSGGAGARGEIRITYNVVTPVKIKDFTIQPLHKNALISWITTYEKDASHFLLQRSFDGVYFSTIKVIPALGNSNVHNKYSYEDINPKRGNVYYRLVQIDRDQTQYTFQTEMIHFPNEKGFTLFNTLLDDDDFLMIYSDIEEYQLSIIDLSGRILLSEKSLSQEYKINTSGLQKGVYIIHCAGGGELFTSKFIKR